MSKDLQDKKALIFNSGMSPDVDPLYIKEGKYRRAINSVLTNQLGGAYTIQNESANFKCLDIPYTLIGHIQLPDGKFVIFSTDDTNSEIGLFDSSSCTYKQIVNSPCLNFKKSNPIKGVSKENFDCSFSIYWVDNGLNPRRYLNISDVPYKYTIKDDTCETKVYNTELDCSRLNLAQSVSYPNIELELESDGGLRNGSYQAAIAYTIDKQRVTNFMGVTNPLNIFSHENYGRSLLVNLSNLDRNFDEFELAVIWTQQGVTSVERIGYYSTAQDKVVVTSVGNNAVNQAILSLDEVLSSLPYYESAEDVCSTSQYLMFVNPRTRKELDYQRVAMDIKTRWVLHKVPKNYYRNGGHKVGYMRDEVYAFGIQWLYKTGDWSPVYHIPGRKTEANENGIASGSDAFENTSQFECDTDEPIKLFEIKNTASLSKVIRTSEGECDELDVREGEMAYHESTELYPDNDNLYGDEKCTPIRHHKMPDNTHAPLVDEDNKYIYILGVKFSNITQPKDENGNVIEDIVGYRILRSNRNGNKTILGKGLLFNTGEYEEVVYNGPNRTVLYPNYPFNDTRPDPFLSKKQTRNKSNKEYNFQPLDKFSKNKFTFHSPSFSFNNPALGSILKIENEVVANVTGNFQPVYKHPKHKLITTTVATLAVLTAAAESLVLIQGLEKTQSEGGVEATVPPKATRKVVKTDTVFFKNIALPGGVLTAPRPIMLPFLAFGYILYASRSVDTMLRFLQSVSGWQTYAYQYNAYGFYNKFLNVKDGNSRRRVNYYQYLLPGIQTVNGVRFNNYNRESSVYLELNEDLEPTTTIDNTRNTIRGFNLCGNLDQAVNTTAASYYGSIKRRFVNQYGQLESVQYLAVSSGSVSASETTSPTFFGGDSYVSRYTVKRKHSFFNNTLFDVQNGFEWDYRHYRNVGFPRFWADHTEFDSNEVAKLKLPSSKHNLDCSSNVKNIFVVKNRYYYLYNSGIVDFYVESEYNLDYRDWDDTINGRHYDRLNYTDLSELFRSDRISYDNKHLFNSDYLKQLTENVIIKQNRNYDPSSSSCFSNFTNRVVYSLPQTRETIKDHWRIFLYNDYYDFSKENGKLTTVKNFNRDQLLFLFDRSSPYFTLGLNTVSTDQGNVFTLGSGRAFEQLPQRLIYTDFGYGNCQSKYAFVSSQFGLFYPSQRQGRVFIFTGQNLDEISRDDMHWWFKKNLPSKLLEQFPNYKHSDNPVKGVGMLSTFDNNAELYYLTKVDYAVKEEYIGQVVYSELDDKFLFNGFPIELGDPVYFENGSWTISYDPKLKVWVSFHDWHPNWTIQTENHFITVSKNSLWKHNERCDLYCNYYGRDYPWEIEFIVNNGGQNMILHSLEWNLEAHEYSKDCYDSFHNLNWNFDEAFIFNTEQNSGLLSLNLKDKRKITDSYKYPQYKNSYVDVGFDKAEQMFRLNQFVDLTNDRGEFSGKSIHMWDTTACGYRKVLNPKYINYKKNIYERKKFRHTWHSVILRRTKSDNVKGVFKMDIAKQLISLR
jgi:hypothetical protein